MPIETPLTINLIQAVSRELPLNISLQLILLLGLLILHLTKLQQYLISTLVEVVAFQPTLILVKQDSSLPIVLLNKLQQLLSVLPKA